MEKVSKTDNHTRLILVSYFWEILYVFHNLRTFFKSLFFIYFTLVSGSAIWKQLDLGPHSEKLLDPDPDQQKIDGDPQPCFSLHIPLPNPFFL